MSSGETEPRRHMGDEARLAAAGRSFEQDGEAAPERRLEDRAFIALRLIEGDMLRLFPGSDGRKAHGFSFLVGRRRREVSSLRRSADRVTRFDRLVLERNEEREDEQEGADDRHHPRAEAQVEEQAELVCASM